MIILVSLFARLLRSCMTGSDGSWLSVVFDDVDHVGLGRDFETSWYNSQEQLLLVAYSNFD